MKDTPKSLLILIMLLLVLVGTLLYRIYKLEAKLDHNRHHAEEMRDHKHDEDREEEAEEEGEFPLIDKMGHFFYFKNKLGRAIYHKNPELSAFYLGEIEEIAEEIIEHDVYHDEVHISSLMQDKLMPAIENLDAQLKSGDNKLQLEAFENMVNSCNSCHKLAKKPFIHVEIPKHDVDGQDFAPEK